MAGREIPSSVPSTMRPASVDYVKMNPQVMNHKHKAFNEKEAKGCMPKGSTHSSAPSRYVNYQTLGLGGMANRKEPHRDGVTRHTTQQAPGILQKHVKLSNVVGPTTP
ncbi:hypothetical protein QQP08_027745 [Theobroma cacao]|nr:hypothetical protein QQP08_027745 [Theobroma cacao]